jgi:phage/plasmid-associated DNA primase
LNDAIRLDPWCRANNILSGVDYLKCWIASLFQAPTEPLPYLFFYGPQNSGKSIFHEAISLLLTKGYQKADIALTNPSGFNGELEGALLCVVEEVDLSKSQTAYNRIKDWVTGRQLNVRQMYRQPYHVTNTTHWVQAANDRGYCPVFRGDTRVTVIFVDSLDPLDIVPKKRLIAQLEREAPDFLAEILSIELPESPDRLNIPPITTQEKEIAANDNRTDVELFFEEKCKSVDGSLLNFGDVFNTYLAWCGSSGSSPVSRIAFGRQIPEPYIKGRVAKLANVVCIGNCAWAADTEVKPTQKLVYNNDNLIAATTDS